MNDTNSLNKIYTRFPSYFNLPFILDGATGTSLMREGMPSGACPEKWIMENPLSIKKIQTEYIKSGSNAVYAPTFGCNSQVLKKHGLDLGAEKINIELVSLSKNLSDNPYYIGGDMSPTGCFIEPFGEYTFDEVVAIYMQQAQYLNQASVDFFCIETCINLCEVRAAILAIKEVCDKPIFVTLTVNEYGKTMSGDDLLASFITLADMGISAFGTNCSVGPSDMINVLKPLVPYSIAFGIPLIAKPNAGMPHKHSDGSCTFDLSSDEFAKFIPEFLNNNIFIIGGCCGTDDNYIKEIKNTVDTFVYDAQNNKNIAKISTQNLACTNKLFFDITIDNLCKNDIIIVDDDLLDNIENSIDYIYLKIMDMESAKLFIENAYMIKLPVVLKCDINCIDFVKKYYNGKLLIL